MQPRHKLYLHTVYDISDGFCQTVSRLYQGSLNVWSHVHSLVIKCKITIVTPCFQKI